MSPAAAAATIVQRELLGRCGAGGGKLATSGASLSGPWLGGGDGSVADSAAGASDSEACTTDEMRGGVGVGMARSVTFSALLGTTGSLGGGGGRLERRRGMSSDSGASPPRPTVA